MLKQLKIENFRCFQAFELQQLGRVNLLVGTNNSGKTSILEAIRLLKSPFDLAALAEIMEKRNEYISSDKPDAIEFDVCHLFYNHEIRENSNFAIFGNSHSEEFSAEINPFEPLENSLNNKFWGGFKLAIKWWKEEDFHLFELAIPLSLGNGLDQKLLRRAVRQNPRPIPIAKFLASASLTTSQMINLFEQVVLTPEEGVVVEALQTIEPNIERIASVGMGIGRFDRDSGSGFVVQLADSKQRIPIGSMGDGIWRILGLALAIVNAKDGVLLVDEIDTGLHFSAMTDMWKMIWKTAQRLNVQVFATTHNSDCWTSLAEIARAEDPTEEGITIQRIEKGKSQSVVFTERELVIAAERGIEVR